MTDDIKRGPARAEEAYRIFLDLGSGRTCKGVWEALKREGKAPAWVKTVQRWCAQYSWIERARQHDLEIAAELEARQKQEFLAAMAESQKRRLNTATIMHSQVVNYLADVKGGKVYPLESLDLPTVRVARELFETASTTERLEYGQATERREVGSGTETGRTGPVKVEVMDDRQLQGLRDALADFGERVQRRIEQEREQPDIIEVHERLRAS